MDKNPQIHFLQLKLFCLEQIFSYLPFKMFRSIIRRKYSKNDYLTQIKNYFFNSSYKYSEHILNEVMNKNPNQILLLNRDVFLPIYAAYASGVPLISFPPFITLENNPNNPFCANDYSFNANATNRDLILVGGLYYSIDAGDYYKYLTNFRLPDEKIKADYIQTFMPKFSEILENNNIHFSDFEYYTFYKNTADFAKEKEKKKKILKFFGIKTEYVNFFKKNHFYRTDFVSTVNEKHEEELIGYTERFFSFNGSLAFIMKKIRILLVKKNTNFTVYSVNKLLDVYSIEEECNKSKKVPDVTWCHNGITVTEYFNSGLNEIEPVISFTTSQDHECFEYDLAHFRLGIFVSILYEKQENFNMPKIFFIGSLVNHQLRREEEIKE